MGRRTLDNIERKILKQTIKLGALNGLDHISTIEIAQKVGISEGTIFVHFKTKENLIFESYKFCENIIKSKLIDMFNKAETMEELYDCWSGIVEVLVDKFNIATFLYNYFISKYFVRFAFIATDDIVNFINKWLAKSGNSGKAPVKSAMAVWNNIYFGTLRYVIFEMNVDENEKKLYLYHAFQTVNAPIFIKYKD